MNALDRLEEMGATKPDWAEGAFLACCLQDTHWIDKALADGVDSDLFGDERNKLVYEAMRRIRERGDGLDAMLLGEELRASKELEAVGGVVYLADLMSRCETSAHAKEYLSVLLDGYALRQFRGIASKLAADSTLARRFSELQESAQLNLARMSDLAIMERSMSFEEVGKAALERFRDRRRGEAMKSGNPLKLGCVEFDLKLGAIDKANSNFLTIIAGLPSQGKSSLAMQLVSNVVLKQKKKVAVFQLETGNVDFIEQMAAQYTAVNLEKVQEWEGRFPRRVQSCDNLIDLIREKLLSKRLWVYEADFFIEQIVSRARHLHAACGGLDMIVVDYLQLVQTRERHGNREQAVAHVSRQLKLLGKRLGVSVIALAQVNRELEKENRYPRKSDLRESGGIEQDADRIIIIYRPKKDSRGREQNDDQEVFEQWLCQVKNRRGRCGARSLLFYKIYTRFADPPNVSEEGEYLKNGEYDKGSRTFNRDESIDLSDHF